MDTIKHIGIFLAVFYGCCGVLLIATWLVEKIRNRDIVELRDIHGEPLGMTKAQYRRYVYALGTKNPELIAKVVLQNKTRREQLKQRSRWTKPLTIVTLTLACASAAHAQASTWAGLAEYSIGEQYYDQGDYINALASLEAAWKALPMPVILYDLALTHYKLDNVYTARRYLRAFVKTSHAAKYPQKVNQLSDKIAAAIDEDYEAQGLDFACDMANKRCGIAHWPKDVLDAWSLAVAKEMRK